MELLHLKDQSDSHSSSSAGTQSPPHLPTAPGGEGEPPPKQFCHLAQILEQRLQEDASQAAKKQPGEEELGQYLAIVHSVPDDIDPINFWVQQEKDYPLLASLAVDLLSIPGSSAPIEHVFSTTGESSSGKRNHLSAKYVEREVLLRKNKAYL